MKQFLKSLSIGIQQFSGPPGNWEPEALPASQLPRPAGKLGNSSTSGTARKYWNSAIFRITRKMGNLKHFRPPGFRGQPGNLGIQLHLAPWWRIGRPHPPIKILFTKFNKYLLNLFTKSTFD